MFLLILEGLRDHEYLILSTQLELSVFDQKNKLLIAAGRVILGEPGGIRVSGDKKRVDAFHRAISSSKSFNEILHSPDSSIKDVMSKLRQKRLAARRFKSATGIDWPF